LEEIRVTKTINMPKETTEVGRVVRQYLKKFPNTSKRTIAAKLLKDHPLLFNSEETARTAIRYHTGANGSKDKKKAIDIIEHKTNFSSSNPYGLPPTEAKPFEPYILPKASNNILFLTDIHLPYHDINALTLALKYGKERNVNTIYLNGDIMDCYKASFHEQNPNNRDMSYELEQCREFLDLLKREFPNAKIFYKEGNHEMRWERFLRVKAPICLGMEEFRLSVLLKLGEKGVTWIENKTLTIAGKLSIVHGNEMKGGGGINVARTLWLRASTNIIAGDKHKTQDMIETDIQNNSHGAWSVGCLCELNPDYLPYNRWNHGFAIIIISSDGSFEVQNKRIVKGKVV